MVDNLMRIEELKNRMVKLYGLEHSITITFFHFCEHFPEVDLIKSIVVAHENYVPEEEE